MCSLACRSLPEYHIRYRPPSFTTMGAWMWKESNLPGRRDISGLAGCRVQVWLVAASSMMDSTSCELASSVDQQPIPPTHSGQTPNLPPHKALHHTLTPGRGTHPSAALGFCLESGTGPGSSQERRLVRLLAALLGGLYLGYEEIFVVAELYGLGYVLRYGPFVTEDGVGYGPVDVA